jgi:putative addiction module component (TIGR02574 family)
MTTLKIRQKVDEYLNRADERILKAVYAMLKEYGETPAQSMLSDEQYEEIEKRWKKYKNGKSKYYTLEEVKHRLQKR